MTTSSKTFVCKLTTPELRKRKATVIAELRSLIKSRNETDDGFAYTFESSDEL